MKWKSPDRCELCRKELKGFAEISSEIGDGVVTVTVRESLETDFAHCRICLSVICQASCFDRRTGFCRACAVTFQTSEATEAGETNGIYGERNSPKPPSEDILASEIVF